MHDFSGKRHSMAGINSVELHDIMIVITRVGYGDMARISCSYFETLLLMYLNGAFGSLDLEWLIIFNPD